MRCFARVRRKLLLRLRSDLPGISSVEAALPTACGRSRSRYGCAYRTTSVELPAIVAKPTCMKRAFLGLILCLLVTSVSAQDWAKARLNNSPRHGEWVEVKSGERTIKA